MQEFENKPVQPEDKKESAGRKIVRFMYALAKILFVILLIGIAYASFEYITTGGEGNSIFEQFQHLILSKQKELKGENEDRINILLLGIGGEGHEGPNLTDTMILVSYKPSENKVAMISIPRDLLVETPKFGERKINHVYALSEANAPGSGSTITRQLAEEMFSTPVRSSRAGPSFSCRR